MGYSILIVDDSATTRAIIKRTIQMAGIPVEKLQEAANGREALSLLSTAPVDLVLADLHMPEMDGEQMTRELKKNEATRSIPVVVVSAEPNTQRISDMREQGISGYLRKPFSPEAIRKLVSETLGVVHA